MWQASVAKIQDSVACVVGKFMEKGPKGKKVEVWRALGTCYAVAHDPNPMFLTNHHVVTAPPNLRILELAVVGIVNAKPLKAGASILHSWKDIDLAVLETSPEGAVAPVVTFDPSPAATGASIASMGFPLPGDPVLHAAGGSMQLNRRLSAGYVSAPDVPLQMKGDPAAFDHYELNLFSYGGLSGAPCFDIGAYVRATNRGTHVHGKTSAAYAVAVPAERVVAALQSVNVVPLLR